MLNRLWKLAVPLTLLIPILHLKDNKCAPRLNLLSLTWLTQYSLHWNAIHGRWSLLPMCLVPFFLVFPNHQCIPLKSYSSAHFRNEHAKSLSLFFQLSSTWSTFPQHPVAWVVENLNKMSWDTKPTMMDEIYSWWIPSPSDDLPKTICVSGSFMQAEVFFSLVHGL